MYMIFLKSHAVHVDTVENAAAKCCGGGDQIPLLNFAAGSKISLVNIYQGIKSVTFSRYPPGGNSCFKIRHNAAIFQSLSGNTPCMMLRLKKIR